MHYALRPWPWIIVALASLVVYPDLATLRAQFPNLPASMIQHDLAYPAMLTRLPAGLLGIVVTSLIAAYMSTISTQLNYGSSIIVNDVYRRIQPGGAGWTRVIDEARAEGIKLDEGATRSDMPAALASAALATIGIWALIFAGGYTVYGRTGGAIGLGVLALACGWGVRCLWPRLSMR